MAVAGGAVKWILCPRSRHPCGLRRFTVSHACHSPFPLVAHPFNESPGILARRRSADPVRDQPVEVGGRGRAGRLVDRPQFDKGRPSRGITTPSPLRARSISSDNGSLASATLSVLMEWLWSSLAYCVQGCSKGPSARGHGCPASAVRSVNAASGGIIAASTPFVTTDYAAPWILSTSTGQERRHCRIGGVAVLALQIACPPWYPSSRRDQQQHSECSGEADETMRRNMPEG